MKNYKKLIILINLSLLIAYFVYATFNKEDIIKDGKLVLLELAPIDPRSLMQGDYMILDYAISQNIIRSGKNIPKRGFVIIKEDESGIAKALRIQTHVNNLKSNEIPVEYTYDNNWNFRIGAESYFFQEGNDTLFNQAKYGGLRINSNGNSVLIGLFDKNKKQLN